MNLTAGFLLLLPYLVLLIYAEYIPNWVTIFIHIGYSVNIYIWSVAGHQEFLDAWVQAMWSQFFPPPPPLTEKNLPRQDGKVFLVTGGTSGIGFELAKILYRAGGRVYITGRTEKKAKEKVEAIQASVGSVGVPAAAHIDYIVLKLDDLDSIPGSVNAFMAKVGKLDVLWNNAGVQLARNGSYSAQGLELHLATNCLGPLLLTHLLIPWLREAALNAPLASVRVVWTASVDVDLYSPERGMKPDDFLQPPSNDKRKNYITSKTGNWFLASKMAQAVDEYGILSLVQNPGNLRTEGVGFLRAWVAGPFRYEARYGAYTELYAGLSPELTMAQNGQYIIPWGRIHPSPRRDVLHELGLMWFGRPGVARHFVVWCSQKVHIPYDQIFKTTWGIYAREF